MPHAFPPSRFFMASCSSFGGGRTFERDHERRVMLFDPKHGQYLGRLEAQLRCVQALTPDLMLDVLAEACPRFATRGSAVKLRIHRLIESGAWTGAALVLVELGTARR